MTEILVNNYFNTTDISVYEAWFQSGTWRKEGLVIDRLKGDQNTNADINSNGICVTYWPTTGEELQLGFLKIPGASTILDVYDVRAGHMPDGYYANWRGLHVLP